MWTLIHGRAVRWPGQNQEVPMEKQRKFMFGRLAVAVLAATMTVVSVLAVDTGYSDVDPSAWYAEAVIFCQERGLMTGTSSTTFEPESEMTRAMLAMVLYRMVGEPAVTASNTYTDVVSGSWYETAVLWSSEHGLMNGYGGGKYGPDDYVTREQMVTVLWRYAGSPVPADTAADFADESEIANWAADAVDWARENGVVSGVDGNLYLPKNTAKRSEIATVLMNYMQNVADAELEPSPWEEFLSLFGYLPEAKTVPGNSYISDGFVAVELEDGSCRMTYQYEDYTLGVDVSTYQKNIDWEQVAASGIEFAIIRVGYRGYTAGGLYEDAYFKQNIEGALAAGLDVGVYFFSQAVTVTEAVEEAEYVIEMIRQYDITYPVIFDWERVSTSDSRTKDTGEEVVTACAAAFCEVVEAAGYIPMYYASPSKAYQMDLEYLTDYPFWLAHYTTNMAPTSYRYYFDMWQYTSSGSVPGISGNVDMNICMTRW